MACAGGQKEVVDHLIKCDPSICADVYPSLSNACMNGNKHVVSLLMDYATEDILTTQDSNGNTPLMLACEKGNVDVIVILLEKISILLTQSAPAPYQLQSLLDSRILLLINKVRHKYNRVFCSIIIVINLSIQLYVGR